MVKSWLAFAAAVASCSDPSTPATLTGSGTRWSAADGLFHADPRWLGADAAYAIDLGGGRAVWLFGDSFIADDATDSRSSSTMVRNSIAIMDGRDPTTATMTFAWRDGAPPGSFFAEDGADWFWPGDGVRIPGGPLVIFLEEQRATPGQGLGFAAVGWRAARVANPDDPPASWTIDLLPGAAPSFAADATVGACATVDESGDHLVALAVDSSVHDGRLARWSLAAVAAGDLAQPEWWDGAGWTADDHQAAVAIPDGATECSLHRDDASGLWVHTASRGFGATTIAIRTAPALEGPWSAPRSIFTPPESQVPNAFVYAGKAHPFLAGAGLVVTYADNSFTFSDLFDPARAATLYWPHFAILTLSGT